MTPGADSDKATALRAGLGRAALVAGIALHLLFLVSLFTHWLNPLFVEAGPGNAQGCDFFGIYQAGDNLLHGRSIYALEGSPLGSPRHVPYFYFYRYLPPTSYLAALSAALFTPWPAYWIWVAITEGMLGLVLISLFRTRARSPDLRVALAGITLGFTPFYLEQWMGQFSFLMAVFLWGTFWPAVRGSRALESGNDPEAAPANREEGAPGMANDREETSREILGGLDFWFWTAAVALKNYPALFAFPLLRVRRWRRVVLCAGAVTLSCIPYYLFFARDGVLFVTLNFRRISAQILPGTYGLINLVRALSWRLAASWGWTLLHLGPLHVHAGNLPMAVVGAAVGLLSLVLTWRMRRTAVPEAMALWTLTFFLTYKEIWEYHYVMLLPVIWLLSIRGDWRWPLFLGLLLALPTPYIVYRNMVAGRLVEQWPLWLVLVHFGSKVFPTIGLYAVAARRTIEVRRP